MANKKKTVKSNKPKTTVKNEVKETFTDERPKKEKGESTFNKIMNVILWIVLLVWMAICLVDFYNTHQEKEPMFCLKKEVTKYDDGQVRSCLGLGYKVFHYERSSFRAIEFGPFWSKDRTAEEKISV